MREVGWTMAAMLVLAGPGQAQLRLPGVQLPGAPLQSLQRGIAQADSTAALNAAEVPPAWIKTGCPCGDGTTLRGPFTLKNRPTWLMGRTLAGSATRPFSLFQRKASASTLDHSALQTAMNSSIRS